MANRPWKEMTSRVPLSLMSCHKCMLALVHKPIDAEQGSALSLPLYVFPWQRDLEVNEWYPEKAASL